MLICIFNHHKGARSPVLIFFSVVYIFGCNLFSTTINNITPIYLSSFPLLSSNSPFWGGALALVYRKRCVEYKAHTSIRYGKSDSVYHSLFGCTMFATSINSITPIYPNTIIKLIFLGRRSSPAMFLRYKCKTFGLGDQHKEFQRRII